MGKFETTMDILFEHLVAEVRTSQKQKSEYGLLYLRLNTANAAIEERNDTIKRLKDEIAKAGVEVAAVRAQRDKFSATVDRYKFHSGKYRYLCEVVRTLDIALGCAKQIKLNRDIKGELDKLFLAAKDASEALDQG